MQISINNNNKIVAYASIGTLGNGIECVIPESVINDNPLSYLYLNGEFIKNTDYKPPTETEKTVDEQIEEIQTKIDELNLSVDSLVLNSL